MSNALEHNEGFQDSDAYRYILESDELPSTDEAWEQDDFVCKVKLFNPTGPGTWWIAGYDPDRRVAVGVAEIHEREAGDIWMPELVEFRGVMGLPLERDLYYEPKKLSELLR